LFLFGLPAFGLLRHQLGLQEYRKLDLPRRSADVIQAVSRSEKQLGGLLPGLPRLVRTSKA
jgi:hypothetical protein